MELIKGNLAIVLGMISAGVFVWLWSVVDQGAFRQTFCFYRKSNRNYEWKMMGRILIVVSLTAIGIYYLLCKLLQYKGRSPFQMSLIVLCVLTYYLILSAATRQSANWRIALAVGCWMLLPYVLLFCIWLFKIQFDRYCTEISIGLGVLDLLLLKRELRYWKEGDF